MFFPYDQPVFQNTPALVVILLSFNCMVAPLHNPEDGFSAKGNLKIRYKYHSRICAQKNPVGPDVCTSQEKKKKKKALQH